MYEVEDVDYDSEPEFFDDDELPSFRTAPLDPLSSAVKRLRTLSRELRAERHPLAHVAQQIANDLVDVRAPAAPAPIGRFEPSPTGNCRQCGAPLPLPTMRRGRPRTLCLTCSPARHRDR
jgi:hypothetical protein